MRRNTGNLDRWLRALVVAPLAVVLALVAGPGTFGGMVALVVATVMLGTAAVGFCPLYALLGIDTCPRRAA